MTTENKQIKFQFVVDEQSAQRVKTLISDMTSAFSKLEEMAKRSNLGAAMGGGSGGMGISSRPGMSPQSAKVLTGINQIAQPLLQSALANKDIFQAAAQGSKTVIEATTRALSDNVTRQKAMLKELQSQLEDVSAAYLDVSKNATAHNLPQKIELDQQRNLLANRAVQLQTEINRDEAHIQGLSGGGNRPPGTGSGDGLGRGREAREIAFNAAMAGKMISGVVGSVGGAIQQSKVAEIGNLATINQAGPGRLLNSMLRGDYSDMYFMKHRDISGKYMGTGALTAEAVGNVGGKLFDAAGNAIMMGAGPAGAAAGMAKTAMNRQAQFSASSGIAGNLIGAYTSGMNAFKWGGIEAQEMQAFGQGIDLEKAADPVTTAMFDQLNAEKVMRAQAARRLGGMHMGVRAVGAGYGYTFGESIGIAESIRDKMGLSGLMGTSRSLSNRELFNRFNSQLGERTAIEEGLSGLSSRRAFLEQHANRTFGVDRLGKLGIGVRNEVAAIGAASEDLSLMPLRELARDKLAGMDQQEASLIAQRDALDRQVSGGRVRAGRGTQQSIMQLMQMGIGMGAAVQGYGDAHEAFGGKNSEKTMQTLEKAIQTGIVAGYKDPKTIETLVSYIGEASTRVNLKEDSGLVALTQFLGRGTGGRELSVRQAQARTQGLEELGGLYSGNAYYSAVGIAMANQELAPGASAADRQLLVRGMRDPKSLLTGGLGFDLIGMGGKEGLGKRAGILQRMGNQVIGTQMRGMGEDVLQAWITSGGNAANFSAGGDIGGRSRKELVQEALLTSSTFGKTEELATAMTDMMMSVDSVTGLPSKTTIKKFGDAAANSAISMEEKAKLALTGEEMGKGVAKELGAFLQKMTPQEFLKDIKEATEQRDKIAFEKGGLYVVRVERQLNEPGKTPSKR